MTAMKHTAIQSQPSHSLVLTRASGNPCLQTSTLRSKTPVSCFQPRIHPLKRETEYFRATDLPLPAILSAATTVAIINHAPIQYP